MSSQPILYSYFRSSCSWRVRIALYLKNIPYEYKGVNLLKKENLEVSYRSVNPDGRVPTFQVDGMKLTESISIIEYLNDIHPEPAFYPDNVRAKAAVKQIALHIACNIQPIQNFRVLLAVGEKEKMSWGKKWIQEGFESLEKLLCNSPRPYCYGNSITIADICLVPQVYNAKRFGVDFEQLPTIHAVYEALKDLPCFKLTAPNCQPDTPPGLDC